MNKQSCHFEIEQNHVHGGFINMISKLGVHLPVRIAEIIDLLEVTL